MGVDVRLTLAEMCLAANVGIIRQISNMKAARQDRYGRSASDPWGGHIEGAAAEMAVAKHFALYWAGAVGNLEADDAGPFQVRHTIRANGCLILHKQDKDKRYVIEELLS